jgi:hypothetical protein
MRTGRQLAFSSIILEPKTFLLELISTLTACILLAVKTDQLMFLSASGKVQYEFNGITLILLLGMDGSDLINLSRVITASL